MPNIYTNTQTHTRLHPQRNRRHLTSITPWGLETPSSIPHASIKRAFLLWGSSSRPSPTDHFITEQRESRRGGEGSQLRVATLEDLWTNGGRKTRREEKKAFGKGKKKPIVLNLFLWILVVFGKIGFDCRELLAFFWMNIALINHTHSLI